MFRRSSQDARNRLNRPARANNNNFFLNDSEQPGAFSDNFADDVAEILRRNAESEVSFGDNRRRSRDSGDMSSMQIRSGRRLPLIEVGINHD